MGYSVRLGVGFKINEIATKGSVLGGQGPRYFYSALILANVFGDSFSFQ